MYKSGSGKVGCLHEEAFWLFGGSFLYKGTVATNGNPTDTKKAVNDAKEADKKANNAKNAVSDEKKNNKRIIQYTAQIEQKQKLLRDLDSQRAAIIAGSASIVAPLPDSVHIQ